MSIDFKEELAVYEAEEQKFQFEIFTNEDAWRLGSIMGKIAIENSYPVTLDICYKDQILFRYANTGANPNTAFWIGKKARTVMYAQKSTIHFGCLLKEKGETLDDLGLSKEEYVKGGGGFPLTIKGEGIVGSICVSGLTAENDHKLIIDALTEFTAN